MAANRLTGNTVFSTSIAPVVWLSSTLLLHLPAGVAEEFRIRVLDENAKPVPGFVVALEPLSGDTDPNPQPGTMDQIDRQFVPHILIVQRGASVAFPNSDSIKHHVYSFSSSKIFEIKLFGDAETQSVSFENPGEVELGCNVHDWMLGYIYVTDTPYYSRTAIDGFSDITAPAGDYVIRIWHPRLRTADHSLSVPLDSEQLTQTIQLRAPMLPNYEQEQADEFREYD